MVMPTAKPPVMSTIITITVADRPVDFSAYGTTSLPEVFKAESDDVKEDVVQFLQNFEADEYEVEVEVSQVVD